MAAAQSSYGLAGDLPSSSSEPSSPSMDLEDCISQEMEAQAGVSADVGAIPYLRTPLLLHQRKNVLRMTQLEEQGHGILLMDAIGMGKTLQTLCLILKTLNQWSTSQLPGSTVYPAPRDPLARTRWDDAWRMERWNEPMLNVNISQATLVVVQEANLQHWAREIRKHTDLPEHCVVVERGNPSSVKHLLEAVIILVSREAVTKLHKAPEPAWFLRMRFLRLVLDEGATSTAATCKSRHSLMIQAIHADRKVLVDATPYDAQSTWFKEMGDTWVFFSAERSFQRVQLDWDEKVVKGRHGPAAGRLLVQQFLSNHLVRSQERDRPQLPEPIFRTVSVQFTPAQAFAYNRIVTTFTMSCLYSGEDLLGNNRWLDAAFLNLKDCTLDAFAFDLVCNPERLLDSFDLEVLRSRQAFKLGQSDVRTAEKNWAVFLQKTAANVTKTRLAEIGDLLRLHDPTGVALSRAPEGVAARRCSICREDSHVANISPLCGHCICIRCLMKQKAENERRLAGSSGSGVWTKAHLRRLTFRCECGKAFGMDDLWAQPTVCLMPYGLSYDGSPKLAFILDYVLQHPEKKVLIYICNAQHRDLLLNYLHSLGIRVAHFCLSGARESADNQTKIAREKELFALPAAQVPLGEEPVNVALVAGTTAAGGVRGTDLHATDVLLIVEPNLEPRVEKQLIGRVHRVGQTKRVEIVKIKVEGTFEDDAIYDLSMSKRERLLALRPLDPKHIKPAENQPNGAPFREAFPVLSVVWWAKGPACARELASVRHAPQTHRTVTQRGKVFVNTFRGENLWADPQALTLCTREELLSFGPAQLGPHCAQLVKFALASEARYKSSPQPAANSAPETVQIPTPQQEENVGPQSGHTASGIGGILQPEVGGQSQPLPGTNGLSSSGAKGTAPTESNVRLPSEANLGPQSGSATPLSPRADAVPLRQEADALNSERNVIDAAEERTAYELTERTRKGKQRAQEERAGIEKPEKRARLYDAERQQSAERRREEAEEGASARAWETSGMLMGGEKRPLDSGTEPPEKKKAKLGQGKAGAQQQGVEVLAREREPANPGDPSHFAALMSALGLEALTALNQEPRPSVPSATPVSVQAEALGSEQTALPGGANGDGSQPPPGCRYVFETGSPVEATQAEAILKAVSSVEPVLSGGRRRVKGLIYFQKGDRLVLAGLQTPANEVVLSATGRSLQATGHRAVLLDWDAKTVVHLSYIVDPSPGAPAVHTPGLSRLPEGSPRNNTAEKAAAPEVRARKPDAATTNATPPTVLPTLQASSRRSALHPEGRQNAAAILVLPAPSRAGQPGGSPVLHPRGQQPPSALAALEGEAENAAEGTEKTGTGEATVGRQEESRGRNEFPLDGVNLDRGVETARGRESVEVGVPLTPARDLEQGKEMLTPVRNSPSREIGSEAVLGNNGGSEAEGWRRPNVPRDPDRAELTPPTGGVRLDLGVDERPGEGSEQHQLELRRDLFGGALSGLPSELPARGPLSPEPRVGVPPNQAHDNTGDVPGPQVIGAGAARSHSEALGAAGGEVGKLLGVTPRQDGGPNQRVGSPAQETGSVQPGSSLDGTSRDPKGAEMAEGRAAIEQAAGDSSPREAAGELEACLLQFHVPQPTIAWLAEEGITMHNLEAGCLSRGEVLTMVREGLFPKDLFSLGTILLLEKATQQHRKA